MNGLRAAVLLALAALLPVTAGASVGTASEAHADTVAASPGGRIAFERQAGPYVGIDVMNADGTGLRRLTRSPWDDGAPAWSPDGRRIAFVSARAGGGVYIMAPDGSGQHRLTAWSANFAPPAWSPDGRMIACSRANGTIYVMNANGTGQRNLTPKPWDASGPTWSPDGRRIAFFGIRRGRSGIYVMNADGTHKRLLLGGARAGYSPAWSPAGPRIAFASRRGGISTVRSDGSGLRRLTSNGDQPAWSPDGRWIAFRFSSGDGEPAIAVMNSQGGGPRTLTEPQPHELDGNPSWTARMPHPATWVARDLGTLGGRSSSARALNGRGQVVGRADTKEGLEHAFIWQNGKMRDIDPLGDPYVRSAAVAINERGQVLVNTSQGFPEQRRRAFVWDDGAFTEIGAVGTGDVQAMAINERGQVIGRYGNVRAFVWQDGVTTDLGDLGGMNTFVTAINNGGQVVGYSQTATGAGHAFLWEGGRMSDLGTFGGAFSSAAAINARGLVVGVSTTAAGETDAFLWRPDDRKMVDLGTLGGASSSARAINDRGQIAGSSETAAGGPEHGFLWDGVMTDLGSIDPDMISNRGQVLGRSRLRIGALVWEDGVLSELPGRNVLASALNEHDQVVGLRDSTVGFTAVLWKRQAPP